VAIGLLAIRIRYGLRYLRVYLHFGVRYVRLPGLKGSSSTVPMLNWTGSRSLQVLMLRVLIVDLTGTRSIDTVAIWWRMVE